MVARAYRDGAARRGVILVVVIIPQDGGWIATAFPTRVTQISTLEPLARLAAIADAGSLASFPPAGESPHLARWGIAPVVGDGITCARLVVDSTRALAMAQDARFLGGSVGANHGEALRQLFEQVFA